VILVATGQGAPGLSWMTVTCAGGFSLSFDRAPGGLRARREWTGGRQSDWKVLGTFRGEGGILREAIRQALLRDPTYTPALQAARSFCPQGRSLSSD
jgi:hypothetical protein